MGLEAGDGFISGLVVTNPVGATDPKAQGDDHLRLIKVALKSTFPNLNAAVTASPTELNYIDGVTGVEGTGKIVLALTATLPALSGVNLTALNASNLASGTVPDARFPSTLPALNGSALTNLNATNLATGTVADARLSSNVPLKDASNVFTATGGGSSAAIRLSAAQPAIMFVQTGAAANNIKWQIDASGATMRGFALSDDEGTAAQWLAVARSGAVITTVTINGTALSLSGALTTPDAAATEVGYKGAPRRNVSASDNTVATDAGKTIVFTGGSGQTFTMDADPPTDSLVYVLNKSGNNWSVAGSTSIQFLGSTGTITLADKRIMTCFHDGSGNWYCH